MASAKRSQVSARLRNDTGWGRRSSVCTGWAGCVGVIVGFAGEVVGSGKASCPPDPLHPAASRPMAATANPLRRTRSDRAIVLTTVPSILETSGPVLTSDDRRRPPSSPLLGLGRGRLLHSQRARSAVPVLVLLA